MGVKSTQVRLFLFSIVITLLTGCSDDSNFKFEDELYDCLIEQCNENDFNLTLEIKSLEEYLIKEHHIKDSSPESLHQLFDTIFSASPPIIEYSARQKIPRYNLFSEYTNCHSNLDSSIIIKSKQFKLQEAFNQYALNQKTTPFLGISEIYSEIIDVSAYHHQYYKSILMLAVLKISQPVLMCNYFIPADKQYQDSIKYSNYKKIYINIDDSNQIKLNNIDIDLPSLDSTLYNFIFENAPQYQIVISHTPKSSFQRYIDIQNSINTSVQKAKYSYAKLKFNTTIDSLSIEDSLSIVNRFRKTIKEVSIE